MTVKVNGKVYEINSPEDLQAMRTEHYDDWYMVRTRSTQLVQWELDNYQDELDRQDELSSTGSYGKLKEVMARVEYMMSSGTKMYLHDVRCRSNKLDDQRVAGTRIEHKTGFAQWEYGWSEGECWDKLMSKASKGIEFHWEPFKDEYEIVMPLAQLLEYLAQYNPSKGLKCWFSYKAPKHQLQIQPVAMSYKRYRWIAELVRKQNPGYEIIEKDEYEG